MLHVGSLFSSLVTKMLTATKNPVMYVLVKSGCCVYVCTQAGANLDMFDEEQRTPLMAACEGNHLDTVKYLLRAGASVSHKVGQHALCQLDHLIQLVLTTCAFVKFCFFIHYSVNCCHCSVYFYCYFFCIDNMLIF